MKILEKRVASNESVGMACGPISMNIVVAELVVEEAGIRKYLSCYWICEVSDDYSFEVTKESIWDELLGISDDLDRLDKIRECEEETYSNFDGKYKGKYKKELKILVSMVKDEIVKNQYMDLSEIEF